MNFFENVNDKMISLGTENGSILELSKMSIKEVQRYNSEFGVGIKNVKNCFFFNRIKAGRKTKGEGKKLMTELVKILDKQKASVVLEVNPYGSFDLNGLIKFYRTYSFVLVDKGDGEALMRR